MRLVLVKLAALATAAMGNPRRDRFVQMDVQEGLSPRYYLGDPLPAALEKRQNKCNEGQHQCVDVGFPDICCPNNRYCFVKRADLQASCCAIGNICDDDCGSTAYFCVGTQTTDGSTTTVPQCCPRACPTVSHYQCEEAFGGGCCQYDQTCRPNSKCAARETTESPLVTPLDEGCTTSQHRCEDGDGCCNNWQHCTTSGTVAGCAAGNPSMTGVTFEPEEKSEGLSDGAAAGIGVGVTVAAALIVGAITWMCLAKRRARAATQASGVDNMTEATAESGPHRRGITQDYVGPPAAPGPFTMDVPGSDSTTPAPRGVPTQPHDPSDIAAPVEIDSKGVHSVQESLSVTSAYGRPTPEASPEERYELEGSDPFFPVPSPPSQHNDSSPMPSPPSPGNKSPPP